jgi:PAS domain S-box-containing protein
MTPDHPRFFETLVRATSDAVVFADEHGVIRFWNRGAERVFGHSADEALGRSLDLIIPEPLRPKHWDGYRRVMATGESQYRDGELLSVPAIRKSGERISVEFTIVPFRAEDGRLVGIAAILRDVTKTFEELKRLRRQASEASRR